MGLKRLKHFLKIKIKNNNKKKQKRADAAYAASFAACVTSRPWKNQQRKCSTSIHETLLSTHKCMNYPAPLISLVMLKLTLFLICEKLRTASLNTKFSHLHVEKELLNL